MNCEDDQALLERVAHWFAMLLVVLLIVVAPLGLLPGSVVGIICGCGAVTC
jgi:hypothetical protein